MHRDSERLAQLLEGWSALTTEQQAVLLTSLPSRERRPGGTTIVRRCCDHSTPPLSLSAPPGLKATRICQLPQESSDLSPHIGTSQRIVDERFHVAKLVAHVEALPFVGNRPELPPACQFG